MSIHQLEILAGSVRRRNFTRPTKEAIVSETLAGEMTLTEVARRHDLDRSLVYRWRRELGVAEKAEEPRAFVPVKVQQAPDPAIGMPAATASSATEIHVGRGRSVRVNRGQVLRLYAEPLDIVYPMPM
ncbi:transposase [Rhizobium sp. SEMIA 4085]|nr:transposase [Rhizobium sp. SEMIA 4085]